MMQGNKCHQRDMHEAPQAINKPPCRNTGYPSLSPTCVFINIWSCIFYFLASLQCSILFTVGANICFSAMKPFFFSFIYSLEFLGRCQRTGVDLFHFNKSVRNCTFSNCTKCDRHHSVCFT